MWLTGHRPIADPRLDKQIHVSATRGCLGNQSVLKWPVVLEIILEGGMFLTEEEPYSQAVLCARRQWRGWSIGVHEIPSADMHIAPYRGNSLITALSFQGTREEKHKSQPSRDLCNSDQVSGRLLYSSSTTWLTITFLSLLLCYWRPLSLIFSIVNLFPLSQIPFV